MPKIHFWENSSHSLRMDSVCALLILPYVYIFHEFSSIICNWWEILSMSTTTLDCHSCISWTSMSLLDERHDYMSILWTTDILLNSYPINCPIFSTHHSTLLTSNLLSIYYPYSLSFLMSCSAEESWNLIPHDTWECDRENNASFWRLLSPEIACLGYKVCRSIPSPG